MWDYPQSIYGGMKTISIFISSSDVQKKNKLELWKEMN